MMHISTKRVTVIAVLAFVTMILVVGLSIRTIMAESAVLSVQMAMIEVDQSQQVALTRIQKLAQETKSQRDQLHSYYLESQSDSIGFLNYIEQLAGERGVDLTAVNPTEVERDGQVWLSVGYKFSGSLAQVEAFIRLLENIPYASQLTAIELERQSSVLWQTDVSIEVAVLTYESTI